MKRHLSALLYATLMTLTRAVVRSFGRWQVTGLEHFPREGAAILVANHLHLFDPPLVMAASPRRLRPMAKREIFETPLIGWVFWGLGVLPVRRFSADIGALRAARHTLQNNEAVLIFPEGTRSPLAALQPVLPGAAMVALLTGAPIIPVAITGTEGIRLPGELLRWLRRRRRRLTVHFGEPFALPDDLRDAAHAEAASDFIMRRVASLLPPSYRGAYGPGSEGTLVVARRAGRPTAPPRAAR